jgi:chemotaxis signal transduction protein
MFGSSFTEEETMKIEILEFMTAGNLYGIDINAIKEIIPYKMGVTPLPNSQSSIEGIIMPRDSIIPVVDLAGCLKLTTAPKTLKHMLIVLEIHDMNIAFHVESVRGIRKVEEQQIQKESDKYTTEMKSAVTGTVSIDGKRIEILDFKNIISMINPDIL